MTALIAGLGLSLLGCQKKETAQPSDSGFDLSAYARFLPFPSDEPQASPPHAPSARRAGPTHAQLLEREAAVCRARIDEARLEPALPLAPKLEAVRGEVLARGKAEPIFFVQEPAFVGEVSSGIAAQRRRILQTHFPRDTALGIIRHFDGIFPEVRQLLLRDGYFYTDDPATARELTVLVGFEDLFNEPELILERGSLRHELVRKDGLYRYASGTEKGRRARLLLFDRVWVKGETPGPSLHLDVRELARREGIDRMHIDFVSEHQAVALLLYGEQWVPALLAREGSELSLDCLWIEPTEASKVGRARDESLRRSRVMHGLRAAISRQVEMGLPFDEPKTERGQQDGKLKERWEMAYFSGKSEYSFNGDRYEVFDRAGQPRTPQVCVDFVTETLERASGMHYQKKGTKPEKVRGALDFDELLGGKRRQELALRAFARENPERLHLLDYPMNDWVKYEKVGLFFKNLAEKDLRAGDVVIIRGRGLWDQFRELHTHTFFIYETDPISGVATLLAGNSGKPRIVTWDDEMLRAPKRSIRHRIRPNAEWLYDHLILKEPARGERWAAPLVVTEDGQET